MADITETGHQFSAADQDALEKLMDRYGPRSIIERLGDIAGLKADHIQENWQDRHLASRWKSIARDLHARARAPLKFGR